MWANISILRLCKPPEHLRPGNKNFTQPQTPNWFLWGNFLLKHSTGEVELPSLGGNYCEMWSHCLELPPPLPNVTSRQNMNLFLWECDFITECYCDICFVVHASRLQFDGKFFIKLLNVTFSGLRYQAEVCGGEMRKIRSHCSWPALYLLRWTWLDLGGRIGSHFLCNKILLTIKNLFLCSLDIDFIESQKQSPWILKSWDGV